MNISGMSVAQPHEMLAIPLTEEMWRSLVHFCRGRPESLCCIGVPVFYLLT